MTRVALFVAGLAGAFLAALVVGRALDIGARTVVEPHGADADAGHATSAAPGGLSLEQDGYRLVAEREALVAGPAEPYVFRILDPNGDVLRDYDVEHERRLHLIVVSRPLDRFLHVHPQQRADGAWMVPLALPESGSYRVFADFTTDGERRTLGLDLEGRDGASAAEDPRSQYDVALHGHGGELEFTVSDAGKPVELQPYLGARGHLVVLREGDLAYIHAHADADRLSFDVPFPSEGRYKLFLQFKVGGTVETVSQAVTR
ncbi:MAG TPA: hypothetical protein VFV62_06710 [Gaiellaceae bacterium]|nr:hypothetical protein [Gaiellaceae bacterium]